MPFPVTHPGLIPFLPHVDCRQVMAHRHRHPEDHEFFCRLNELFVVEEEKDPSFFAPWSSTEQPPTVIVESVDNGTGSKQQNPNIQIFRIWTR